MKDSWKKWLLAALVVSAFFESSGFSFTVFGFRVRNVQVLAAVILGLLVVMTVLRKWRWQRSPLDIWLLAYVAVKLLLQNFRRISESGAPPAPQAPALFAGLSALFASYVITTGFWLPMTWVFLGLNIASLRRLSGEAGGRNLDGKSAVGRRRE
ncbi:MAG: hypothetical protein A2Y56_10755 [Candidatus Aminicenantes bacterium RBG_13_63_10]|nr:MAG: hypothetical protein A2Y56_10755 [Candidatus Aminicenantes bacterium RBG_13_63_10]